MKREELIREIIETLKKMQYKELYLIHTLIRKIK